jgi:uncharacterized protein (DUF362 family)/NAD-dependent dihydropyrimidine dehydrogenase PreA subunit
MKDIVSLTRCRNYERKNVLRAMEESIANLGGLDTIFKKDHPRIFLKVNQLSAAKPEEAVTTHPEVIYALSKILKEKGASVVIGDSPGTGTPYKENSLKKVYSKCGLIDAAADAGAELNYDTRIVTVSYKEGRLIKQFNAIKPALDADILISLAKGKTHSFTYITGAVKNLFGMVPGFEKAGYHFKLQSIERFSKMLVDICEFVKPELSFIDAIVCMEGDGPNAGNPKEAGVLIASWNPHAADAVFCDVIGIDCRYVPTIKEAMSRNLLNLDNLEVRGTNIADMRMNDFKMPATFGIGDGLLGKSTLQPVLRPIFKDAFTVKPSILKEVCIGCGICVKSCPVSAIVLKNNIAVIDYDKCVRCYCCHEMCPHHSIELSKSTLYKIMSKAI